MQRFTFHSVPFRRWLVRVALATLTTIPAKAVVAQQADSVRKVSARAKPSKVYYGTASFYAKKFQGRKTANGERFNHQAFTCACNVLPFGTWVRITNLRNGKQVVVKVNDRLHHKMKRLADLTHAAASQLGFIKSGLTRIKLEVLGKRKPV
jgi:rare lipoprotein A